MADVTIEQLTEITAHTGLADGDSFAVYDTSETSVEPTKRVELDTLTDYFQNNLLFSSASLQPVTKTANYSVLEADSGKLFVATTNSGIKFTLPSIATLSDPVVYGFLCSVSNGYCYVNSASDFMLSDVVYFTANQEVPLSYLCGAVVYSYADGWLCIAQRYGKAYKTITSDYNFNTIANIGTVFPGTLLVNHTSSTVTVTMPSVFSINNAEITIKYINTGGTLTIARPDGSSSIDGAASISTTVQYSSVKLVKYNAGWAIVSQVGTWT